MTPHEPDPGKQEGTLYRIIRLLTCSGLVAGSLWLPDPASAAEPHSPRLAGLLLAEAPDVARQRVLEFLDQADRAWQAGDQNEAVRLGLAADSLARRLGVQFAPSERSPGSVLAGYQGLVGAPAPGSQVSSAAAMPAAANPAPQDLGAVSPDEVQARVQSLLQAAESDVRGGRTAEALQKANQAQQLAAKHQIKFGVLDLKPVHIISAVRQIDPNAQLPAVQSQAIQTVGYDAPTAGTFPSNGQVQTADNTVPASGGDPKAIAAELMSYARDALDQGKLDEARQYALQARKYDDQVTYGLLDDRPDYILSEIEQRSQSMILPAGGQQAAGNGGNANREQALGLLNQAEQYLAQGNVAAAEQLARQAQQLDATYEVQDLRPELVLQDIQRMTGGRNMAAAQPAGDAAAKAQATELLRSARMAMQAGQIEQAQQLALQADQLDVTYELLEDSPERVLADAGRFAQRGMVAGGQPAQGAVGNEKAIASQLLANARQALRAGDVQTARRFAMQADQFDVPYDVTEDRPDLVLSAIEQASGMGAAMAAGGNAGARRDAFVVPAGATADTLFRQGIAALRSGDRETARGAFQAASQSGDELDPVRQQQLSDFLADLGAPSAIQQTSNSVVGGDSYGNPTGSLLEVAGERREIRADRLRTQTLDAIFRAEKLRDKQPEEALKLLSDTSAEINGSGIGEDEKTRLLASLESASASIEAFANQRRPLIELERRNTEVREQIRLEREHHVRVEQELAKLVDQYGELMDQRRFAEANHIARQARELDPENPVVVQMFWQSQFSGRNADNDRLREAKEETFFEVLQDTEWAVTHKIRDGHEMQFADNWSEIISRRTGTPTDLQDRTDEELRIQESLNKPVSLHFQEEPLASVMEYLANTYLINVVVDEPGLLESGVTSNTPVTINVDGIRLKTR
ncbi:MAG: hypothetical protein R3B90_19565 [Planctomycetaceae bacterium]